MNWLMESILGCFKLFSVAFSAVVSVFSPGNFCNLSTVSACSCLRAVTEFVWEIGLFGEVCRTSWWRRFARRLHSGSCVFQYSKQHSCRSGLDSIDSSGSEKAQPSNRSAFGRENGNKEALECNHNQWPFAMEWWGSICQRQRQCQRQPQKQDFSVKLFRLSQHRPDIPIFLFKKPISCWMYTEYALKLKIGIFMYVSRSPRNIVIIHDKNTYWAREPLLVCLWICSECSISNVHWQEHFRPSIGHQNVLACMRTFPRCWWLKTN